jgi:membrane protease YdiL (CAAX protease family)
MPASRRKTLLFVVPVCLLIGVVVIVSEVSDHGLSAAVIAGLAGGACLSLALVVFVTAHWNRPTAAELRRSREAFERTRPAAVSVGLAAAGVAVVVGGLAGGSAAAAGAVALVVLGVVFVVGAGIVATMAITRPDLWPGG